MLDEPTVLCIFFLKRLSAHQSSSVLRLVSPGGGEGLGGLEVARKTVDTGLNETEAVLGIEVLAVDVQVLTDGHGLLDQVVKILGDGGSKSCVNWDEGSWG